MVLSRCVAECTAFRDAFVEARRVNKFLRLSIGANDRQKTATGIAKLRFRSAQDKYAVARTMGRTLLQDVRALPSTRVFVS